MLIFVKNSVDGIDVDGSKLKLVHYAHSIGGNKRKDYKKLRIKVKNDLYSYYDCYPPSCL